MAPKTTNTKVPAKPQVGQPPRNRTKPAPRSSQEEGHRKFARITLGPAMSAYRVIAAAEAKSGLGERIQWTTMVEQLREQAAAVKSGDLSRPEAMLMGQATALQTLFTRLIETGMSASFLPQQETAMRLALKAQGQCRATLETLAAIKNPPVIYAKQVNHTTGPQQINNGAPASSQAREIENEQSKLLDARATGETLPSYSSVEAVGEINRAKVRRR
jgi:hypothetical protein